MLSYSTIANILNCTNLVNSLQIFAIHYFDCFSIFQFEKRHNCTNMSLYNITRFEADEHGGGKCHRNFFIKKIQFLNM